jgi:hypothetical protein
LEPGLIPGFKFNLFGWDKFHKKGERAKMFITQRVFDPELVGCAVHIGGTSSGGVKFDRVYLVKEAKGETLSLIDFKGEFGYADIKDFNNNLKMVILERPQAIPDRVQVIQEPPKNRSCRVMTQPRVIRSVEQAKNEALAVVAVLEAKGHPIRLETIIQAMNILDYKHWNTNNASSFMRTAMKHGANLKKVKRGIYQFGAEVQA